MRFSQLDHGPTEDTTVNARREDAKVIAKSVLRGSQHMDGISA